MIALFSFDFPFFMRLVYSMGYYKENKNGGHMVSVRRDNEGTLKRWAVGKKNGGDVVHW